MTDRTYDEGCIAAHALDLIGDRWALLVVREMMLGPRRFGALRAGIPGVSANVLTQRLQGLIASGVVEVVDLPTPASVRQYRLTASGLALWPVLRELCLWGARQPGHDPSLFISPVSLMLSLRATCAAHRAGPHRVAFQIGNERFTVITASNAVTVAQGADPSATLTFRGTTNALAAAIYGPMPLHQTVGGLVTLQGDLVEGQAFVDLFALAP